MRVRSRAAGTRTCNLRHCARNSQERRRQPERPILSMGTAFRKALGRIFASSIPSQEGCRARPIVRDEHTFTSLAVSCTQHTFLQPPSARALPCSSRCRPSGTATVIPRPIAVLRSHICLRVDEPENLRTLPPRGLSLAVAPGSCRVYGRRSRCFSASVSRAAEGL